MKPAEKVIFTSKQGSQSSKKYHQLKDPGASPLLWTLQQPFLLQEESSKFQRHLPPAPPPEHHAWGSSINPSSLPFLSWSLYLAQNQSCEPRGPLTFLDLSSLLALSIHSHEPRAQAIWLCTEAVSRLLVAEVAGVLDSPRPCGI